MRRGPRPHRLWGGVGWGGVGDVGHQAGSGGGERHRQYLVQRRNADPLRDLIRAAEFPTYIFSAETTIMAGTIAMATSNSHRDIRYQDSTRLDLP
eukprot:COSAG04_NODE_106_length_25980_cov_446.060160_10_plen_95_part_00